MKFNLLKNNLKHSYLFATIFSSFNFSESQSTLVGYAQGVFMLSFIALFCFINLLFYIFVYIIIQKKDYENRFPRFKKIINFYKNTNLFFVIIEGFFVLINLIILNVSALLFIYKFGGYVV